MEARCVARLVSSVERMQRRYGVRQAKIAAWLLIDDRRGCAQLQQCLVALSTGYGVPITLEGIDHAA